MDEHVKRKKKQKQKKASSSSFESDTSETEVYSSSESKTEEDSEEPKRKQFTRTAKKMESKKRKKIKEDSDSEIESNDEAKSKKRKQVVEDSSPEQTQSYDGKKGAPLPSTEGHYDSSETIPEVNLGSENDPLSQGHTNQSSINKPADSMLSLVEESANDPAEQNMMVVRVETQSQTEALSIVPIQVYTTPVPEIEPTPAKSPSEKINEKRTKSTPEPPKPDESTPTVPPAPSRINPSPEDAAALMMMARTTSYIPKEGPMPSFCLGLTDSSQEEAATQEGQRAKTPETPKLIKQLGELVEKIASSGVKTPLDYAEGKRPQIEKQSGEEIFEKFETPARTNEMSAEMKEKCYVWATRVKIYGDGSTNEYDAVCTLNAQDRYILLSLPCASSLTSKILKDFKKKYTVSPKIVNMAIGNHPNGEFLQPKTKKSFRVEDYPMFIPFLDLKKIASHPYIFAPVCYSDHWWLWVKYVISRIRVYAGGHLSRKRIRKLNHHTLKSQWLEIVQPENVKKRKYEWDNWTQDEVDHYRVEYASRILFHEMN
ncbi:hypothetical protein Ahy_B04g069498 [Arachis hypogaea]|uniref:Ubiquitin-like protease family profile domain-containing protein n=1 Tax=Arachis hypogaea TaxID=3818 RepID=A0A444ZD05_ARAHY|nr:hypothetical protein Ahy_B04g069498 [Arachis hypogaea]